MEIGMQQFGVMLGNEKVFRTILEQIFCDLLDHRLRNDGIEVNCDTEQKSEKEFNIYYRTKMFYLHSLSEMSEYVDAIDVEEYKEK